MIEKQNELTYVKILKRNFKSNFVCLSLLLLHSILSILYPLFIQDLIDEGIGKGDAHKILFYAMIMMLIIVFNIIVGYFMKIRYVDLGQKITLDIKKMIIECVDQYSHLFFNKHKTGDIISILENDVRNVQSLYTYLVSDFLSNTLILLGITLIMIKIDWKITIIIIGVTLIFSVWQRKMGIFVKKQSSMLSVAKGEMISFENDYFSGYHSVKNIGKTMFLNEKLYDIQQEVFGTERKIAQIRAISGQSGFMFQNLCLILMFIYGGFNVMFCKMTVGTLFSMIIYIQKIYTPILALFNLYMEIQKNQASVNRVNSMIRCEEYYNNFGNLNYPYGLQSVKIQDLIFKYDNKQIFDKLNLEIAQGDKCVILGSNGKGKTTLLNLLLRSITQYNGKITIDDVDIINITDSEYRKHVVGLSQKVIIFPGTVYENVTLFNKETPVESVNQALKMVGLYKDINELPLGIDTFLGKKGITLSDGQAQKIHLARLFIINPDIIILDEPTSALDIVAEKEVYDSLFSHFYDKTIIIVSHRRKVLDYCNKVFDFNMLGDRYEERA